MHTNHKTYSIDDINNLITNKIRCGNKLDFCNSKALINGNDKKELWLSKYISSIANSGIQTIIFGIKTNRNRAVESDLVDFSKANSFWLKTLVENEISPVIENINIYEVSEKDKNKGFIIIQIPVNTNFPYMASDGRYYQYSNRKIEVLSEQRVRELYLISSKPNMEFVGIINSQGVPTLENGKILNMNFYPKFLVRNSGSAIEKNYKFELWIPSEFHDSLFLSMQNYFNRIEGVYSVFSVPNRQPLFQNEIHNILEAKLFVNIQNIDVFNESEMFIKLFYSHGLKEFSYKLNETFTFENKMLSEIGFATNKLKT